MSEQDSAEAGIIRESRGQSAPTRGPLSLTPSMSSPQTTAGTDFSIFVTIQNPYDVPVTLYELQTHLPVELIDVNRALLRSAQEKNPSEHKRGLKDSVRHWITSRREHLKTQTGFAVAVGTGYAPEESATFLQSLVQVGSAREGAIISGIAMHFPENPTPEQLDAFMRRLFGLRYGIVPIQLAPGDQVVRQFRLRTRRWIFFTPLMHTFQIQAFFSADNTDHSCSIPYGITIRARLAAIISGGVGGALLGTALKVLTQTGGPAGPGSFLQGATVAVLATLAVIIGFARKAGSQSFVSVEDLWGGALIGFSVGFVGYSQFVDIFGA